MTPARVAAAAVLRRVRQREGFVAELIDDATGTLSPQDRRFVVQLVMGVVRRTATLDALIAPFLTRPFDQLHPDTLDLLRLGVFQIALLTQVPRHSAVDETVELAPPVVKKFVNALLRRVSDAVTDEYTGRMGPDAVPVEYQKPTPPAPLPRMEGGVRMDSPPSSQEGGAGGGRFPVSFRRLARPLLPDPARDLPAYLSAAFSWPGWLADRWLHQHGPDECVRLGFWFNAPPPMWIRVNTSKVTRADYLAKLAAANTPAESGDHPQAVRLLDTVRIRELPGFDAGEFAVQDHSSMLVASALAPKPGWQVLDLCAAPGGKTTHLAELMHHSGRIVACDIVAKRLDSVTDLCRRMGVRIVEPRVLTDGTDAPAGQFDAVLADVPCSNTGVLGRRPEVRWRLQPHEFAHLIRLQTTLLKTALSRTKPGGVVVYSTCSIDPDENGGVVRAVLDEVNGVKLDAEHTSIPGRPSDGGYWARLRC